MSDSPATHASSQDFDSLRARLADSDREAARYQYELSELIASARAIASERDIGKLLGLILAKSRQVTGADAGSVYIVERPNGGEPTLRFMVSQNDSLTIDLPQYTLQVSETSIVGRSVISRDVINIPDLYELGQPDKNPWGFRHNKQFDEQTGYQGRSMLTVPMINQNDEVIGVIQLINKKRSGAGALTSPEDFDRQVVPFDERSEVLALTLASQAGISLENTLLYEDIQRLFESFVNAAVTAIELRDPTTSGHSQRVASLTRRLAEVVDGLSEGPFAQQRFDRDQLKEIEYAALLHDFGKVGVKEQVLLKAKKLHDLDMQLVMQRFDYIRQQAETEYLRRQVAIIRQNRPDDGELAALEQAWQAHRAELDEIVAFVVQANEPTVLAQGGFERLHEIGRRQYVDSRGQSQPYLTDDEIHALSVMKGSLTTEERREIERHVLHTINFLESIPWGRQFRHVPVIAGAHHEKLDGSGYPYGLKAPEIRIESRMMTIADIFDALTASDRPYKAAVPVSKALDIIGFEVQAGKCDEALYRLFIDAKVWTAILPEA